MRVARPWHWLILNTPFGATSGFVAVMLGYIGNKAGMDDKVIAGLSAMNLFPHVWKFFWAPIADVTLTRKKWYLLANAVSCSALLAMAFIPFTKANLGTFTVLIFLNSLAITFLGMAVEGLMAHNTPEDQRGRAAGWFQAGNLGGAGIGGGLALIIANNVNITTAFVVLAAILGACALALLLVPDAPREHVAGPFVRKVVVSIKEVFKDLFQTLSSRRGIIALVLCFMPLGAGAAVSLFGAIGDRWQTSAETVALVTGLLGGGVSAVGCLAGGWFSDRIRRRVAYAISGVILAAVGVTMAIAPQNVYSYVFFTLAYQFAAGMVYGCFTGFVLEVIGSAGAIATKYNALASLSNTPIWYMTLLLGSVSKDHGAVTMLYVDAAAGMVGLIVLLIAIAIVRPHLSKPAPAVG